MSKQRIVLCALVLVIGALGYWLRFYAPVGDWLRDRSGGAAYVMFWILAAAVLNPSISAWRLAAVVFAVTCTLEFLQAWHPAWLEAMRHTLPGRLILGTTFDWLDFPPYAVGALLGWTALQAVQFVTRPLTTIALNEPPAAGHQHQTSPPAGTTSKPNLQAP